MEQQNLSRQELAQRWRVCERTIDRLRKSGQLAWSDMRTSPGKALVRIPMAEVERFEALRRQDG